MHSHGMTEHARKNTTAYSTSDRSRCRAQAKILFADTLKRRSDTEVS